MNYFMIAVGLLGLVPSASGQIEGGFVATGNMTVVRRDHTATLLSDGRVLIAGGFGAGDYAAIRQPTAEIYDPFTGSFTATGNMNSARGGHTSTLLKNGLVLIAGGDNNVPSTAELYDPSTGVFTA